MPPRKGIVKSGNAGNSTKASKLPVPVPAAPDGDKPLFPPGSKVPLNLLHERCQKNGWEKPIVDTRKQVAGWSFNVTLAKVNKKNGERETVRLEPHPPYVSPTALEARHWGATYALYRFCNGLQLNRVLPVGPRQYWDELAAEHKNSPEHMKWMYDADPFAARREVDERQAKAARKGDLSTSGASGVRPRAPGAGEFAQAPEVKMASSLRDLVEDAVKKAVAQYPEAADISPTVLLENDVPRVTEQLCLLGFTAAQARKAVDFLSQSSTLATNLLNSLTPLEASIEYLILHIPECDLPQRFLPSVNSSNPFITSAHSGTTDLKARWLEDKAVKDAGWPAHVVKECLSNSKLMTDWESLVAALGNRLIGDHLRDSEASASLGDAFHINTDEVDALGAHFAASTELVMPLFSAPVQLHILVGADKSYPRHGHTPMYITSSSVAAYVRLHLLSVLLKAVQAADEFMSPGEGFCMAAMRVLEEEWAEIEDNGPPDISAVLQNLLPRTQPLSIFNESATTELPNNPENRRMRRPKLQDDRSDARIKQDFDELRGLEKYGEILSSRQKLPAFSARDDFLNLLERHRVVVVVGETGCGKTTQLPQFILDSLLLSGKGSKASIVVTQPRRISAISVAARVSAERLEDGSVGYAIRGESKQTKTTKLLFCTTGVVLRRLGSGDSLIDVSHIVVDEVHERSVDGDFLLLELRELLKRHPKLKVVLMSATINHETFINYFNGAPLLTIPGFTHPVTDIYLEDVIPLINYRPPAVKTINRGNEDAKQADRDGYRSKGLDEQSIHAIESIGRSDRIDSQLIAAVVSHIVSSTAHKRGGILIFLPGVAEIKQTIEAVRRVLSDNQADILPLHANLSSDEQRRVFMKTSKWKIIAATNVAETSITIDDVIYVIDAGKVKETQYDPETSLSRLVETWVSQAAARQRRGRAGRTQPGVCYKLYTRTRGRNFAKFPIPEILRVPLESISLQVKVMREEEDVKLFLRKAIDPPEIGAMEKAWCVLEELGAVDADGRLTALGKHISMLPVDLRLAKMLILGTIFQCLGPILTIAACFSSKPLFLSPLDKRTEASQARARFATEASDLLTDVKAYDECARLRADGKPGAIRAFCEDNFISATTIRDISSLRQDFISALADLGFIPLSSTPRTPALNVNSENVNLLKAVVLGGLWPRVARIHLPKSAIKFDKVQSGTVQRENFARDFKMFDLRDGRVFLHPGSVLFEVAAWKSPFLVYFQKHMTSKVFLRDATEVPLYALLLFGGSVSVNHVAGGVKIGDKENWIKLKAWPRIGVLVNQLRRLLDAQLQRCVEEGTLVNTSKDNPVLEAMLALLAHDGLSE